jgi:gluconolactonase
MPDLPPWLEAHDDRFLPLVLPNATLDMLADGFAWLEGPVWFADANQLLVSDLPNDRIMRWTEAGVSVFRQPSGFANGHTRDRQGRLIGCSHRDRCITRTEWDGSLTILAREFQGQKLNGPNDVVVAADDAIWFTDPLYGGGTDYEGGKHDCALPPTLYRLDPEGSLHAASDAFRGPNGLCFSHDFRQLYVCETGAQFGDDPDRAINVFDVVEGTLRDGRVFHRTSPGVTDGLRCDEDGRLWASAGDGVHCIAPDGTHLGTILTGATVANLCFGGRNYSRLFICASHRLMAITTNVRGAQRP